MTGYERQGIAYDPGARGYELQGRAKAPPQIRWSLVPTKNVDTEAALMRIAAWLWETEIVIKDALRSSGYDWPEMSRQLATYGTAMAYIREPTK